MAHMGRPFILYKLVKEAAPVKSEKASRPVRGRPKDELRDSASEPARERSGRPSRPGAFLDGGGRLRYKATIVIIHACCRDRMMGMRPGPGALRALMTG